MRLNGFCHRLYKRRENRGPLPSVGVSEEMRQFIQDELKKANEEALLLKQDEIDRKEDAFIPYNEIRCDEECMGAFSMVSNMTPLERKDQKGILPNNTDQQYLFFYGWSFLAFATFVLFIIYFSYPNTQDSFTMSGVILLFFVTAYLLLSDWDISLNDLSPL